MSIKRRALSGDHRGASGCERFVALQDRRLAEETPLSEEDLEFLEVHGQSCASCALEIATLDALQFPAEVDRTPALSEAKVSAQIHQILAAEAEAEAETAALSNRGRWSLGRGWGPVLVASAAAAALAALLLASPSASSQLDGQAGPPVAAGSRFFPSTGDSLPRLTLVAGTVFLGDRPARVRQPLRVGVPLRVGQGRAALTFADGSTAVVDPNTQLQLSQVSGGAAKVQLVRGQAVFWVSPRPRSRRFVVVASWGVVQVVGTVFRVSDRSSVGVQVARGRVRVLLPRATAIQVGEGKGLAPASSQGIRSLTAVKRQRMLETAAFSRRLSARAEATLTVSSPTAGAAISMDGGHVGPTPATLALSPGERVVVVSREGHAPRTRHVVLEAGERSRLRIALAASPTPVASKAPTPTADRSSTGRVCPPMIAPPRRMVASPRRIATPTTPRLGVSALLARAAAQRSRGAYAEAVATYRQLAKTHPLAPVAATTHVLIGRLLLHHLGRATSALRAFDSYLRRYPSGALAPEAAWGRIQTLRRLGRGRAEREACRDLLKRFPSSVYASRVRARLAGIEPPPAARPRP